MTTKIPKATHGSPDRPLKIGEIEIPCYVLDDGRRVLSQRGLLGALDISKGGSGGVGGDRLAKFVEGKYLNPYINADLLMGTGSPIKFRAPGRGPATYGYPATILADICEAVLAARRAGALADHQLHIADRCELLMSGFAKVGIVALVDEATGYQADRQRDELQKILAAYISPELLPWSKKFPDEFYHEMFRLIGWQWDPKNAAHKPGVVGHMTNFVVYERLPTGVLQALREKNPVLESGRRGEKHHQWLTNEYGQVQLREHLLQLVVLMKVARTWKGFVQHVMDVWPRPNDQMYLIRLDELLPPPA